MYIALIPKTNLFQSLKDFFLKSEDNPDETKTESEDTPKWAKRILELLEPKEQEQTEVEEIPLPPVPEEVEEEVEETPPPKVNPLKKAMDFLL